MSLIEQIQKDLDQALKNKLKAEVSSLRMLKNSIQNAAKQKMEDLTKEEVLKIVRSEVKKRNESIEAFKQGNRDDLISIEEKEIEIIKKYLPKDLSDEEVKKVISEIIEQTGASGQQQFGQIMGMAMKKLSGQTDGNKVSELVKELLEEKE